MNTSDYFDDVILKVMGALESVDTSSRSQPVADASSGSDFATNSTGTSGRIASTNAMLLLREMAEHETTKPPHVARIGAAEADMSSPVTAASPSLLSSRSSKAASDQEKPSPTGQEGHESSPKLMACLPTATEAKHKHTRSSAASPAPRAHSCASATKIRNSSRSASQKLPMSKRSIQRSSTSTAKTRRASSTLLRGSTQKTKSPPKSKRRAFETDRGPQRSAEQSSSVDAGVPVAALSALHRYQVQLAASKQEHRAAIQQLKSKHKAEIDELQAAQCEVNAGNAAQVAAAERQYLRNVQSLRQQLHQQKQQNKALQQVLQTNTRLLQSQRDSDESAKHITTLSKHVERLASERDSAFEQVRTLQLEVAQLQAELAVAKRASEAAINSASEVSAKHATLRRRAIQAETALAQANCKTQGTKPKAPAAKTGRKPVRPRPWRK